MVSINLGSFKYRTKIFQISGSPFENKKIPKKTKITLNTYITTMNFNNFTIKSQEAIQQAQILVQSYGQQQIENEHIFKAILEVDENVTPFILKKVNKIQKS